MKLAVAAALALAACQATTDYPDHVGGGGTGGGGGADARVGGDGGGDAGLDATPGALNGTVCVALDLAAPVACPDISRAGVAIAVRGQSATATADAAGAFALTLADSSRAVLAIGEGEATLVPSLVPVVPGGGAVRVPVPRRAELIDLEDTLGAIVPDGSGIVAIYVVDAGGQAVVDAAISAPAGTATVPYYDGASGWVEGGSTGALGIALLFGVPAGSQAIDGVATTGGFTLLDVPVEDDHVTFVTAVVP